MFSNLLNKISAERVDIENPFLSPFFYQHQKAYSLCIDYVKDKIVLEIGSGSGYGTYRLAKIAKSVIGVDKDKGSIKKCKEKYRRKNLKFIDSRIEEFKNKQKFDVIVFLQVIEHIKEPEIFLKEIVSLLKKGGLVIISTPNKITQSYNENPYHYKEYTFEELNSLLYQYFKKVDFLSLYGDDKVKKFEQIRKSHVINTLKKDKFKFRKILPRRLKELAFDIATFVSRLLYLKKNKLNNINPLEKNYIIDKKTRSDSIDIIAICRY